MGEYLANKGINLCTDHIHSGSVFCCAKLSNLKKIYGISTGERIYLIVHDRMEREDAINQKMSGRSTGLTGSGIYYNSLNSSIDSSVNGSIDSSLESSVTNSVTNSAASPEDNLTDQKTEITPQDIPILNSRSMISDDFDNKIFIDEHPPLLWQQCHLEYFLKTLRVPITETLMNVDDFIFLSQNELEALYEGKGELIYKALRSKFRDPTIQKIIHAKD